jgi:hypothetical protein
MTTPYSSNRFFMLFSPFRKESIVTGFVFLFRHAGHVQTALPDARRTPYPRSILNDNVHPLKH